MFSKINQISQENTCVGENTYVVLYSRENSIIYVWQGPKYIFRVHFVTLASGNVAILCTTQKMVATGVEPTTT